MKFGDIGLVLAVAVAGFGIWQARKPKNGGNGGDPGNGGGPPPGNDEDQFSVAGSGHVTHLGIHMGSHAGDGVSNRPYPAWLNSRWQIEWAFRYSGPGGSFRGVIVTGAGGGLAGGGNVENPGEVKKQAARHWHYTDFELPASAEEHFALQSQIILGSGDWQKRDGSGETTMSLGMDMDIAFFLTRPGLTGSVAVDRMYDGAFNRDDDVFEFSSNPEFDQFSVAGSGKMTHLGARRR